MGHEPAPAGPVAAPPAASGARPLTVLTGANGGIGRALLRGLLDAGHDVLAVVRREPSAPLPADGAPGAARCEVVEADLTDEAGRARVVAAVRERFGQVACLINGAGIGMGELRADYYKRALRPEEIDASILRRFFAINAEAPIALAIALLPLFDRSRGRIINVGTSLTALLRGGFLPYAMSKAALEAGSAVLAKDLAGSGITVHLVHPGGPVDTPMARREEPALRAQLLAPQSMVEPVCWLASPAGAGRHGQRLNTRLWHHDAEAAFAPIGWPQLANDSAWSTDPPTAASPVPHESRTLER